jgi:hypothetical protein
MDVSYQRQAPEALLRERPGTHCTGGWVGSRDGLDGSGRSHITGVRSPNNMKTEVKIMLFLNIQIYIPLC